MIKETVTYKDFNEADTTEDLYFHLSKSELIELEMGMEGGLGAYLQKMVQSQQPGQILAAFKRIISAAYGERSEDGKRFVKDEEKTRQFLASPAYDALFMELVTSEPKVTEFILGIVPKDLIDQAGGADALLSGRAIDTVAIPDAPVEEEPAKPWADREPTPGELRNMSREDLLEVFQRKMQVLPAPIPPFVPGIPTPPEDAPPAA